MCTNTSLSYLQVIGERDILGTQLIRRNDELALLYEKIKIQQSTLAKGEAHDAHTHVNTTSIVNPTVLTAGENQYMSRLEDIRVLKLEVKKLRRERNILSCSVANIEDLR